MKSSHPKRLSRSRRGFPSGQIILLSLGLILQIFLVDDKNRKLYGSSPKESFSVL